MKNKRAKVIRINTKHNVENRKKPAAKINRHISEIYLDTLKGIDELIEQKSKKPDKPGT